MSIDRRCLAFARQLLSDYRLSSDERAEEIWRLAGTIQQAIEMELENLAHRRKIAS